MTQKKFVPVSEFQRISGLSYPTVMGALERGELKGIKTESGHWRVKLENDNSSNIPDISERLQKIEQSIYALCKQFNTQIGGR